MPQADRPPTTRSNIGLKDVLLWGLIVSCVGALQQQPIAPPRHAQHDLSRDAAAAAQRWQSGAADSLQHTSLSQHRKPRRDTHPLLHKSGDLRTRSTTTNERALATLSPAENTAARAPPPAPRLSAPTGGIASRHQARSLQDWQVEDIILLATVDGNIHARDRRTGASKWQLETDRAMVETTYHRNNRSADEEALEQLDPLWIVEPSQDGAIYVYAPGSDMGMQKLGYTVKELANIAPYASDGHPAVAYTAEKRNTLYTINAATGHIIKSFSSAGSIVNEDNSCRRVNPLESLDDEECEPIGTLTLGRTEYTIGIQDRNTGQPISTIRYFEWGPNNRDEDLFKNYRKTMDNKYVYTKHDGWVFGLEMASDTYTPVPANKPIYRHRFVSPVARVYDIVRPYDDLSGEASLVVLPQPVAPSPNDLAELEDDPYESIYVNCTQDGSWFAFSEENYPMVTEGAATAQYYTENSYSLPSLSWPMSKHDRERFAGVHQLAPMTAQHGPQLIDAPDQPPQLDPPAETNAPLAQPSSSNMASLKTVFVALVLGLAGLAVHYQQKTKARLQPAPVQDVIQPAAITTTEENVTEIQQPPMVREAEPAKETIFTHPDAEEVKRPDTPNQQTDADQKLLTRKSSEEKAEDVAAVEGSPKDGEVKPKKKATRGKRGGRIVKERAEAKAGMMQAKRKLSTPPKPVEIITVAASEAPQVSGPLQINSLVINTDKVIGQGSGGTCVFEGKFEGRDVAVKRMLSQYYELASQEVAFLQQSDDHPNVVRYYCQQKDDHFLYIAVELCQASLFEVWEPEKARTEERQTQLRALKHTIQQDVPKALLQLADGLHHLHRLRIIHRDIKPQNILVAFPKRHQQSGPRLVISDFGLGKNLPENVSTLIDPTGNAGTSGWKAPELISQPKDLDCKHSQSDSFNAGSEKANGTSTSGVKRAADIFSLGCLFFWVLTDGIHPYEDENGWQQLRELNIKQDNKKLEVLERWSDSYEPMQLITSMLAHKPEHRPTALQVLNHPFFWPPQVRLNFLCDMSDHFEHEPRGVPEDGYLGDSWPLSVLEGRAEEVIGKNADFLSKLDRSFVDTLGKQRKYSGNRMLDLLRAFRNKKYHYEDMPEDVKKKVGPLPGGYVNYWARKFPRLLMACYEVVHEAGLQDEDRFKGYFNQGTL